MELRLNKVKEARATAEAFAKDAALAKSKYRPLGLYYRAFALGVANQTKIGSILMRIALPALSRAGSDEEKRRIRHRMARLNSLVIVPLLVFAGFAPRVATGTSLAAVGITAAAGVAAYSLHGDVKPGAAAIVGIPAVFGVVAGVGLQQRLATRTLTIGFALLLAAVGIRLLV